MSVVVDWWWWYAVRGAIPINFLFVWIAYDICFGFPIRTSLVIGDHDKIHVEKFSCYSKIK